MCSLKQEAVSAGLTGFDISPQIKIAFASSMVHFVLSRINDKRVKVSPNSMNDDGAVIPVNVVDGSTTLTHKIVFSRSADAFGVYTTGEVAGKPVSDRAEAKISLCSEEKILERLLRFLKMHNPHVMGILLPSAHREAMRELKNPTPARTVGNYRAQQGLKPKTP